MKFGIWFWLLVISSSGIVSVVQVFGLIRFGIWFGEEQFSIVIMVGLCRGLRLVSVFLSIVEINVFRLWLVVIIGICGQCVVVQVLVVCMFMRCLLKFCCRENCVWFGCLIELMCSGVIMVKFVFDQDCSNVLQCVGYVLWLLENSIMLWIFVGIQIFIVVVCLVDICNGSVVEGVVEVLVRYVSDSRVVIRLWKNREWVMLGIYLKKIVLLQKVGLIGVGVGGYWIDMLEVILFVGLFIFLVVVG